MPDNDEFLRQFAKQIATALREKEDATPEQQRRNQPSTEESVDDLYRSLVFDEPLVDDISNLPVVASALSRQLLLSREALSVSKKPGSTSFYALSNRLVNGILYLCNQNTAAATQKQKQPSTTGTTDSGGNGQSLKGTDIPSPSARQVAVAKLAFCVLVDLPLECCRFNSSSETNLNKIRSLLGSYKGASLSNTVQQKHPDETTSTKSEDLDHDVPNEAKIDAIDENLRSPDKTKQQTTDEVWAAESDPSDYDYGEGDEAMSADNWNQQESDVDWLDPNVLSKPDPNLSLQQTRDAIGSLLQLASYTLIQPIFSLPQKETSHYVSQLTQLVLVLLQPRKTNSGSSSPQALPVSPSSEDDTRLLGSSMHHVLLSPLWILRDAATYHSNATTVRSTTSNYEQIYLQVLQTLLAMDQAYLEDLGRVTTPADEKPDLCLSSIVGLSSMSAWCVAQKQPTQLTIEAIVDSMNDLDHIVERAQKFYKKNLPNTLIPILDTLSGISYDRLNNNNAPTVHLYKGSAIPQTLLNSGFLRQILALVTTVKDGKGEDKADLLSDVLGFHHALWGLCIAYPKIVGKYFLRYQGSSQIIRSYAMQLDSSTPQVCVQCVLWNIYGWQQCKESGGTAGGLSLLRYPGSTSSATAPKKLTQDECSEVCRKAWSRLCRLVKQALEESNTNSEAIAERVIEEWGRLLVMTSAPSIAEDFKSLVDSSLLDDVSAVVSAQLARHTERKASPIEGGKEDDKEDDKPSRKQKITSQAHKLLKKYTLFFGGTVVGSSKTD